MSSLPYKHIVIIGTTSSGKSTLAEQLSKRFDFCFIDLDALHWEPHWTEAPLEVFRERVRKAVQAPAWVVAGNYHDVRDLIWPNAEVVIWLDYSLPRIFWQLTQRTFKRWWTQELLWGTNRETLSKHFQIWSQESLYHWLFKKCSSTETRDFGRKMNHSLRYFLTNPKETRNWRRTGLFNP